MKFEITLTKKTFNEIKEGFEAIEAFDDGDPEERVIRELFFIQIYETDSIDVRSDVKIRRIK